MLLKQKERILMKLYRKRGMDCSQKATSIPLYLTSTVQNQGKEDGGYEHYLVFLEMREESRNFYVLRVFWERNMVRKKRKNAQKFAQTAPKMPFPPFNLSCEEPFIGIGTLFRARLMSTISSSCIFSVLTSNAHLEVFPNSD